MTLNIYPRYDMNLVEIPSDLDQSDDDLSNKIPSQTDAVAHSTGYPNVLWFGLAILIVIGLMLVLVIPIVVIATSNSSTETSTASTICPTTEITTTVTSSPLPAQCSNYTTIDDSTRSPLYKDSSSCDSGVFGTDPIWIRFSGTGGSLLASCPIDKFGCGAEFPGWFSGIYPSRAGFVTYGLVCFVSDTNYCSETSVVLITNCNGYYIYYVKDPPNCDMRYCTI